MVMECKAFAWIRHCVVYKGREKIYNGDKSCMM